MVGVVEKPNLSKALTIKGWMTKGEMQCLAHFARESLVILEIGSYKGRSARCLADNTWGKVYCVDPWLPTYPLDNGGTHPGIFPDVLDEFKENLKDLIEKEKVVICQGNMTFYYDKLPRMDFAFIDGDHRFEEVKKDILYCQQLVKHEGVIAGHDFNHAEWPGVQRAVLELFDRDKINLHESIWWVTNE